MAGPRPESASGMTHSADQTLTRRHFLRGACGCGAALVALPWLHACAAEEPFDGMVVDLDGLPEGRSVHVHETLPVEILRAGDDFRARSLLCTHQGCQVQWKPAEEGYFCPCHQGRFDAGGRPVAGPPREPLRDLVVRRENGRLLVETRMRQEDT